MPEHESEQQPLLNVNKLLGDIRVPNDSLLRGATSEQVARAIRRALILDYPELKEVIFRFTQNSEQVKELEKNWLRRAEKEGLVVSRARIESPAPRAQHFYGEIGLFEETMQDLRGTIYQRARGAKSIIHDSWHGMRADHQTFLRNFEEGSAEVFSFQISKKYFGITGHEFASTDYRIATEGVALLCNEFGLLWLLESRQANSLQEWLFDSLVERGIGLRNAQLVLESSRNAKADWTGIIQRALKERRL